MLLPNKVIITGTLHKQIFFVADDDIVRHMGEDLNFTTFVDLPGIEPGDSINVMPVVEHVGFELIDKVGDCEDSGSNSSSNTGSNSGTFGTSAGTSGSNSGSNFDCSDVYMEEPELPIFIRLIQRTVIQLNVRGSEEQPIRVATAALPATVVSGTTC
jgi:hypothetical protein